MNPKPASPKHSSPKLDPKDELKTLPMPEVEKRFSRHDGRPHPGGGGKATDSIRAQRDQRKEDQSAAEIPLLFLGSHSLDDRGGGDSVGRGAALAGLRHHPAYLLVANAVVGFWEERQASNAIAALKAKLAINARVQAGWEVDQPAGA